MKQFWILELLVLGFCVTTGNSFAQDKVDFDKDVAPILKKHCAACHNQDDYEAGFSVDSYEDLEEGSDGEAVFEAGDADESWMIQLMTGEKEPMMPPDDQAQPTEKELELLKRWINEGAKDSTDDTNEKAVKPESEQLFWDNSIVLDGPITAAAWSAKNLIAVGRYQSVEFLNGETLKRVAVLRHLGKVNSLQFSIDGRRLLVGGGKTGQEGQANLWDVDRLKRLLSIAGHRDSIYSAVVSPDLELIATSSYDKSIKIWNATTGEYLGERTGHNGAVFDLDFSQSSSNLISASADQTVKVWANESGQRLDTLGQPLKGQSVAAISPDARFIVSGGLDQRIWIWEFVSKSAPKLNPLFDSRFAHDAAIVQLEFSPDGKLLVSSADDKSIKVWSAEQFRQLKTFDRQADVAAAIAIAPNSDRLFVGRLDGSSEILELGDLEYEEKAVVASKVEETSIPVRNQPINKSAESEPNNAFASANSLAIPGEVTGVIFDVEQSKSDEDLFRFKAKKGERLVIETNAARSKSPLDSKLEILDEEGKPVPQVVLRAVRDSYFTFRGKNSDTSDDFRVHNWQEMELNEYLFCNGEVVKLFQHPRGPDSGFLVYPGGGKRHSFFGTTSMSHALQENCYIVKPYPPGTEFQPNGLPVFELNYENDDDGMRRLGRDSRIDFVAPEDGEYWVRVSDARGFQGKDYHYRLTVRPAKPDFSISVAAPKEMTKKSGREFTINLNRIDGYQGSVKIQLEGIPKGFAAEPSYLIEAGHYRARGIVRVVGEDKIGEADWSNVRLTAVGTVGGESVSKTVKAFKPIQVAGEPKIELRICDLDTSLDEAFARNEPLQLTVKAGESIEAKVVVKRHAHQGRISFGQADSGRNLPHGVYIDNIGLNGLMVPAGQTEQSFFITADRWVKPQDRLFYLRANDVQGQVTLPVLLKVVE